MKKHVLYSEATYFIGIILIVISVVLTEKADFGMSMVVAPAYLLFRWINPMWSAFTFGMAEYCFQGALLVLMIIILRKFRVSYLFAFVTAVFYGFVLDGGMLLGSFLPCDAVWQRILYFAVGVLNCAAGVAMVFRTYFMPEVYDYFVKAVAENFNFSISVFKTVYDCISCIVSIAMSFAVFGMWKFVGIGIGTVVFALINGFLIGRFSKLYDKLFIFKDALPWRTFFTGEERL